MTKINLKEQINNLLKLQTIDTEIYSLQQEKKSKPEEIKILEAVFEAEKKSLADSEKALLDLQKKRKEKELELSVQEENAKKLQAQLYQLKTNKEYQAMLQQIEGVKADTSVIEDKILELFGQIDKVKNDMELEKEKLQAAEKVLSEQKKKIADRLKEIDDRLGQLDGQRKQITPQIENKILSQYERILNNRDGLAIVNVEGNCCQGCNMVVPPQVINLIKMYEQIITCEVCNRMLYIKNETN